MFKRLFGRSQNDDDDGLSEEQITVLLESLEATDAYERVQAASHLGAAQEVRAVPGLLAIIETDMVGDFVAKMKDSNAGYQAMALYNEVARAEADLKQAAAYALGRIAEAHPATHPEVLPALKELAADTRNYYASATARDALERLDGA